MSQPNYKTPNIEKSVVYRSSSEFLFTDPSHESPNGGVGYHKTSSNGVHTPTLTTVHVDVDVDINAHNINGNDDDDDDVDSDDFLDFGELQSSPVHQVQQQKLATTNGPKSPLVSS